MVFAPPGPMVLLGGFTVAVPFLVFVVSLLMPVVPELPASPEPTAPAAAPPWLAPLPAAPPAAPAPAARAIEELAARTEAKTIVAIFMCFPFRCQQTNDDIPLIVPGSHGGSTNCHPPPGYAIANRPCAVPLLFEHLFKQRLRALQSSSVKTTDFTLPTGSWIMPLSCSRPNSPQSSPFQSKRLCFAVFCLNLPAHGSRRRYAPPHLGPSQRLEDLILRSASSRVSKASS
jgi:hypothetical protein